MYQFLPACNCDERSRVVLMEDNTLPYCPVPDNFHQHLPFTGSVRNRSCQNSMSDFAKGRIIIPFQSRQIKQHHFQRRQIDFWSCQLWLILFPTGSLFARHCSKKIYYFKACDHSLKIKVSLSRKSHMDMWFINIFPLSCGDQIL